MLDLITPESVNCCTVFARVYSCGTKIQSTPLDSSIDKIRAENTEKGDKKLVIKNSMMQITQCIDFACGNNLLQDAVSMRTGCIEKSDKGAVQKPMRTT